MCGQWPGPGPRWPPGAGRISRKAVTLVLGSGFHIPLTDLTIL